MDDIRIAVIVADDVLRGQIAEAFDVAPPSWRPAFFETRPPDADVVVGTGTTADVPAEPVGSLIARLGEYLGRPAAGKLIAVTGASGGCGATTIALHLAKLMPGSVYLENDPGRRSAAERLGINGPHRTWATDDLDTAALPIEGIRALLAPPEGTPSDQVLRSARAVFSPVITEPGRVTESDAGVLVVVPTVVSVTRAARWISQLPDEPWAIVLNRTNPDARMPRPEVERRLGVPVTIELPYTQALMSAESRGRLLSAPWSRWYRGLRRLAGALESI